MSWNLTKRSTLWFIGLNEDDECGITDDEDQNERKSLTLIKWSESKQVVGVCIGFGHNIFAVKTEKTIVLCTGFVRRIKGIDIPPGLCQMFAAYLGRNEYWAAGKNDRGQLGLRHSDKSKGISRVHGMDNVYGIRSGSGAQHTLWIKRDRTLYSNGRNEEGQLGLEHEDKVTIPTLCSVDQSGSEMKCIEAACSGDSSIVLCDDGGAWIAGYLAKSNVFKQIQSLSKHHIVNVAAGFGHILFIDQNGKVFGMGRNDVNELGLGDGAEMKYDEAVPIPFFNENGVKIQSVCCGYGHSLALSEQHVVYAWGRNDDGQCGMENTENQDSISIPTKVDIPSDAQIVTIKCGLLHSGCMTASQEVFLWGLNEENECCVEDDDRVWSPQSVNEFVLRQAAKAKIVNFYLGWRTSMFLLQ